MVGTMASRPPRRSSGTTARDHHVDQTAARSGATPARSALTAIAPHPAAGRRSHRAGSTLLPAGAGCRGAASSSTALPDFRVNPKASTVTLGRPRRRCRRRPVGRAVDAPQAVGQRAAAQHLTDRIRQAGDLPQPGGDAVEPLRSKAPAGRASRPGAGAARAASRILGKLGWRARIGIDRARGTARRAAGVQRAVLTVVSVSSLSGGAGKAPRGVVRTSAPPIGNPPEASGCSQTH